MYSGNNYFAARSDVLQLGEAVVVKSELHDIDIPCRVALIENGTVNELFVERTVKRGLVGNIYKGKVVRVLPGMQAAFVDIGLSRTAFLHINDMVWPRSQPTPNVFEYQLWCRNFFLFALNKFP